MMTNNKIRKDKKGVIQEISSSRIHKANNLPDDLIRFSFRHFTLTDKYNYPIDNAREYLQTLIERLKALSNMKVSEFRQEKSKSLRIHKLDWRETTEPEGFAHLNSQLQDCEPWQFQLTVNEHGRIHGILIDEVFYIVWFDVNHLLYSVKN